jgi:hypothetical protein
MDTSLAANSPVVALTGDCAPVSSGALVLGSKTEGEEVHLLLRSWERNKGFTARQLDLGPIGQGIDICGVRAARRLDSEGKNRIHETAPNPWESATRASAKSSGIT